MRRKSQTLQPPKFSEEDLWTFAHGLKEELAARGVTDRDGIPEVGLHCSRCNRLIARATWDGGVPEIEHTEIRGKVSYSPPGREHRRWWTTTSRWTYECRRVKCPGRYTKNGDSLFMAYVRAAMLCEPKIFLGDVRNRHARRAS